ncbi:MAG: UDP-N-acetylmuramoyl-tripeptide--D-alanyl-D-alanine ligase, partial [Firmicutes bacterium]|nr:UDP-N-acetylmuramoyl-tripeptide--D-alanyl-D-alanine ligase [Bacillota bacterium]
LAAAAVGRELDVPAREIAAGMAAYGAVGGRANVIETDYIRIINDCYNANPNSMTAAILSLANLPGRKVALLGDMMELGRTSEALHREIGVLTVQQGIDCVICCGARADAIYKGIISTGEKREAWHFPMKEALLSVLPSLIRKGDNVLVKASHGMHFEELVEELRQLQ